MHAIQAVVPKSAAPGAAASLIAPATPIPARVQQVLAEKDQQRYDREKVISSALRSSCVGEVKLQT